MEAQAVLFDLDGVLVQTEPLKARAHVLVVERLGGHAREETYWEVLGRPLEEVARTFLALAGLDTALGLYQALFEDTYGDLLCSGMPPVPGAPELLVALGDAGWRIAVVTSNSRAVLQTILARAGLQGFHAQICAEDVPRAKPAPDPYLKALAALGVAADHAVAVEDTQAGIQAALSAGVPVVALEHAFNGKQHLDRATSRLTSLADTGAALRLFKALTMRGKLP